MRKCEHRYLISIENDCLLGQVKLNDDERLLDENYGDEFKTFKDVVQWCLSPAHLSPLRPRARFSSALSLSLRVDITIL